MDRTLPGNVTLTGSTESVLTIGNTGSRPLRALVRDAWQPSAGAQNPRQRVDVPAGERRRMKVLLKPARRGDLKAPHVTLRAFGPLQLAARQRTLPCPGSVRVLPPFHSRRHLPSKLRKLRELDGKAAVQIRGRAPSSIPSATMSVVTTSVPLTGAPRRGAPPSSSVPGVLNGTVAW